MISKIDSNYDAICKLFNFSKETTTDINKKLLLQMAKNGEDRPHWKSKLGRALSSYTLKSKICYDAIFDKKIRELRPDWFITSSDKANKNKKLLLQMAKNGEDRPHWKLKISKSLTTYTSKKNKTYDPVFTEQIKKLRPDWFKK